MTAGAAFADTIYVDGNGDTVSGRNISYGPDAASCANLGQPVAGQITVSYNGGTKAHFAPGESLTVTFTPPSGSGITASLPDGQSPVVPSSWGDGSTSFPVAFTTTVPSGIADTTSAKVDVSVTGNSSGYSAGSGGSGMPGFNVSVSCSGSTTTDTTAPTVTMSHSIDGTEGWNKTGPVTVDITATDPDDPVADVACTDSLDAGTATPLTVSPGTTPGQYTLSVTGDGTHQLSCVATDSHGNVSAPATDTVKLDTTPPTITYTGSTPGTPDGTDAAGAAWFKRAVTLTWSCTDATSGALSQTVSQTLTSEGRDQTATGSCVDHAGNTASSTDPQPDGVNIDMTPPDLNSTAPDSGTFDVCSVPGRPSIAPTDALSGVDPATVEDSWTAPSVFGLGTWSYHAEAGDYATNQATLDRAYTASSYGSAYSGVLQPVNANGSSRFKLGSTIPVKFRLMCGTTPITNANATLWVSRTDVTSGTGVDEAISTSAATTGNLFRYDPTGQQYIFNLSTKLGYTNPNGGTTAFSTGGWTLSIDLGDGTGLKTVAIQLVR